MADWRKWFESVAPKTAENAGLRSAREISRSGARDLPMGPDSLTGYTILNADSLEEAEAIARENPFISSIRIYEIAAH